MRAAASAALALALACRAWAGEAPWHLFNPAPQAAMRPMQSDRPDKTEGPFTVDAGHAQLEMDLASASLQGGALQSLSFLPFTLKLGLTDSADLEWMAQTWILRRTDDGAGGTTQDQGFGDMALRLKINLWGNAQGLWATGLIPFVGFPSAERGLGAGAVSGGIIFPQDFRLPGGFELGAMAEFDVSPLGGGVYGSALDLSLSLSRDLGGGLGAFAEYFSSRELQSPGGLEQSADAGFSLQLGDNAQADCGANLDLPMPGGLELFAGLSLRL